MRDGAGGPAWALRAKSGPENRIAGKIPLKASPLGWSHRQDDPAVSSVQSVPRSQSGAAAVTKTRTVHPESTTVYRLAPEARATGGTARARRLWRSLPWLPRSPAPLAGTWSRTHPKRDEDERRLRVSGFEVLRDGPGPRDSHFLLVSHLPHREPLDQLGAPWGRAWSHPHSPHLVCTEHSGSREDPPAKSVL